MTKQLDMFDDDLPEVGKKAVVLENFELNAPDFLEKCRSKARRFCYLNKGLIKYREPNTVTIDDVRELMGLDSQKSKESICPHCGSNVKRQDNSNKILGSVFRKGFKRIGSFTSNVKGSHGRPVGLWKMLKKEGEV